MPIYEYQCKQCSRKFSELQDLKEKPLQICELCGGKLKKLLSLCSLEVNYQNTKEYYEKTIKPDAKRIAQKIKDGDENAAADIFGEPKK